MTTQPPTIWDPIGEPIDPSHFSHNLQTKLAYYQKHPRRPLLILILLILVMLVCLYLGVIFDGLDQLAIISTSFPLVYAGNIILLQSKLVLFMLAQKNNWLYAPDTDTHRAKKFAQLFPQMFDKGHSQVFSQQIWGTTPHLEKTIPFYSTKFVYSTLKKDNHSEYNQYIFVFPLPKILHTPLILEKKSNETSQKAILETESIAFNKTFIVSSSTNTTDTKTQIMKLLSPALQTRLLEFSDAFEPKMIILHHNLMIISTFSSIWYTKHTNLFLSPTIHDKDIEYSNTALLAMAELTQEMIEFIN